MRVVLRGALILALAVISPTSHAGRPDPPSVWAGLDRPSEHAPPAGVHAVRPPIEGRVRIERGSFVMGSSDADVERAIQLCKKEVLGEVRCDQEGRAYRYFADQEPAHVVSLSAFAIDRREVRVDEYLRCTAAGACRAPAFLPNDRHFSLPSLPVTSVRWDDARDYCQWAGGRLPTEAEWEFAARGPSSREFPWGSVYNGYLANHGGFAPERTDGSDGFLHLAPPGSFPDGATPTGLVDMSGNVSEWVFDYYERDRDTGNGYPSASQVNPTGPTTGAVGHVIRGGSFIDGSPWMRAAWRGWVDGAAAAHVGFRCAADVSP